MTRAVAKSLALVNWRGVFYQRYALDPRVTALEGANGAGKTTVMIAAYVVLLPDMSLLRFTNVGEHGVTGGDRGLYGRLGEAGSPTYAVLDLLVGDERLVAGVQIERRAEPSVDLTPFVITGLSPDVQLHEVLLDRPSGERAIERVPEVPRLRDLAAKVGGKLKTFSSAKDYFSELFERGVTPLRLATDDERKKYNEMLRTSMMGGISRTLAEGLRGFLLKEETGLADTLKRMRQNLDTCRRTRGEVTEARQIEAEIADVYDAGLKLFAAAVHATRERADELHAQVLKARSTAAEERQKFDRTSRDHDAAIELRDEARRDLAATSESARAAELGLRRLSDANRLQARIQADEVTAAARAEAHDRATRKSLAADQRTALARAMLAQARDGHTRAATGLADFKQGFEELERRAAEHRLVVTRLAEARRALPEDDVQPAVLADVQARCEARLEALDAELAELARRLAIANQQRAAFARVHGALVRLVHPEPVAPADAHGVGERCLADLRDREACAREKDALERTLKAARGSQDKQEAARRDARAILGADAPLASESLHLAHQTAAAATQELSEEIARTRNETGEAERARQAARAQAAELAHVRERWVKLRRRADLLRERHGRPTHTRGELRELRAALEGERDATRRNREDQGRERERVAAEILALEHSGGSFDPALLRARDLVGGELLAGRFDDIPLGEAGELQARLGPLHAALVVDDVRGAAEQLATARDRPETIWLVGQDAPIDLNATPERIGRDLLVPEVSGCRLSRIPELPTLGRRARQCRIENLRGKELELAESHERLTARESELNASLAEIDALLPDVETLERADPQAELERARREEEAASVTLARLTEHLAVLEPRRAASDRRRSALLKLLPVAHLLDPPDFGEEATRLAARLAEAVAAAELLRRCAEDRRVLSQGLETLRSVPPTDEELAAMRARQDEAAAARDVLQRATSALRFVQEHVVALSWTDAEAALAEKSRLRPGLERQLEIARQQLTEAEAETGAAEEALRAATERSNTTDAELKSIVAALAEERERFAELGIEDASDAAVATAQAEFERLAVQVVELTKHEREMADNAATWAERLRNATKDVEAAEREVDDRTKAWEPEQKGWEALQKRAEEHGLLAATATPAIMQEMLEQGSVNLWSKVTSYTALLAERLRKVRDGADLGERVRRTMAGSSRTANLALEVWLEVRDWLRRRVPAQIAEVDDPLAALARLREHLVRLETRLREQEEVLRGETNDVARNIETAIRKAHRQIARLNGELERVRFGSIRGVRIRVDRVERMDQVLRALKEGEAQELLWQRNLAIEDALDELFRQVGGGKISGHRLLDYREYLGLVVEVTRHGSSVWEVANPTRMSTGEAIGVGAALMMVVLTAWERDANLLRARRSLGTLRILFLDEANRLSQDNLAILFDLCENLELQLLLAAPEVARAKGNTTYRLVRQLDALGREEVLVTGRRAVAGSA